MLTDKELWQKIREIEIKTSKIVSNLFSGEYKSAFKGKGLDFKEFKEYEQGDDPRHIDWKVSAKKGSLQVKKFSEERELTLLLVLDISNSTLFGSDIQLKREIAAEFCASIAFSGVKNGDKVGLIIFSDKVVDFIPPKKGRNHVIRILKQIIFYMYKNNQNEPVTNIEAPLKLMNRIFKKRTIAFLISDFWSDNFEKELKLTSYRHDLISVVIEDKGEIDFPDVGLIEVQDSETSVRYLIDTGDKKSMKDFRNKLKIKHQKRADIFKKNKIDQISINTHESYITPLNNFFRLREKIF